MVNFQGLSPARGVVMRMSDPEQTSVLLLGATCRVTPWLCPKPAPEHWWFRFQRKSDGKEQI